MPMIQRVAAAERSSSGAVRKSKANALPSAAASESRRVATRSMSRARISPITTPTARQRSASSIAHSTSRGRAAVTVISRSGAMPAGRDRGHRACRSRQARDPRRSRRCICQEPVPRLARHEVDRTVASPSASRDTVSASAKPVAAGGLRLPRGRDFVQCAASEPAAERVVDRAGCRAQQRSAVFADEAGCCLHRAELLPQPARAGCRSLKSRRQVVRAAEGHGSSVIGGRRQRNVHDLFY